jgi:glucose-1-phosphate thymidylyltransferase
VTTQAVILARGLGTRMRRVDGPGPGGKLTGAQERAAASGLKGMIPVGRPFLDYVLSSLADAGITRAVLVIGPEHEAVREHFAAGASRARVRVEFAVQAAPRGTADAVLAARRSVGNAAFLVLNADNYYPSAQIRELAALDANGIVAFDADALIDASGIEPDRVLGYALVDFDEAGWLRSIVEKPPRDHPAALRDHRWVSMNLWSFTPRIFAACERVEASPRGELELQSAVMIAIREMSETFRVIPARAAVLDLSTRADIAAVADRLSVVEPRP